MLCPSRQVQSRWALGCVLCAVCYVLWNAILRRWEAPVPRQPAPGSGLGLSSSAPGDQPEPVGSVPGARPETFSVGRAWG